MGKEKCFELASKCVSQRKQLDEVVTADCSKHAEKPQQTSGHSVTTTIQLTASVALNSICRKINCFENIAYS